MDWAEGKALKDEGFIQVVEAHRAGPSTRGDGRYDGGKLGEGQSVPVGVFCFPFGEVCPGSAVCGEYVGGAGGAAKGLHAGVW